MSKREHKLYHLTEKGLRSYSHRDASGNLITQAANDVPMIVWPDGRWCMEANVYIQGLYSQGKSRRDRGGTLFTYTTQISPLIRFCFKKSIKFHEITDQQFSDFIETLKQDGRNSNTVVMYGRRCLDFLSTVGEFHDDSNFLGKNGRIRAHRIVGETRVRGKKAAIQYSYWHHRSFPKEEAVRRRLPISDENIEKLRESVLLASSSLFIRKRRYTMLSILEITGARRYELAQLKVSDVEAAAAMQKPFLKFITAKKRGDSDEYRKIPISRLDLDLLLEYIKFNRSIIIKKLLGKKNDHGFVFISQTTGKPLQVNTITQELYQLRKAAGIAEQACAHMFRHAFISKLFIALKEQHQIENLDGFRAVLLDVEGLLSEILQWTGHSSIESLMVYIHQSLNSKARIQKTVDKVHVVGVVNKLQQRLFDIEKGVEELSLKQTLKMAKQIIKSARQDLEN